MTAPRWTTAAAVAVMAFVSAEASAQLAEAVRAEEQGTVRFSFETKDGVQICDDGITIGERRTMWRSRGRDASMERCRTGSAELELELRDGRVRKIDVVTPSERSRDARDLGDFRPGEAAGYLLSLVYRGATSDAAEDAIFPAMIADVDGVWREVLEIARDRSLHEGVRKNALFWIGQEAADAAIEGLAGVATDESEAQDVRNSAIFALSQRDDEEAIPILIEIAETAEHAETRRTAMFWLAQSDDPRVIRFFEDILLRKGI